MSHSSQKNIPELKNVREKFKNTKAEIEHLKTELELLIKQGSKPEENYKPPPSPSANENYLLPAAESSDQPTKKTRSYNAQEAKNRPLLATETCSQPSKKPRNYNVQEARDYIKKQQQKRDEQLKTQMKIADNALDLKRQKLRELQLKTKELVTKNIQLKRERSKSRESPPLHLDRTDVKSKLIKLSPKACEFKSKRRLPNINDKAGEAPKVNSKLNLKRPSVSDRGRSRERPATLGERQGSKSQSNTNSVHRLRVKSPVASNCIVGNVDCNHEHCKTLTVPNPEQNLRVNSLESFNCIVPKIDTNYLHVPPILLPARNDKQLEFEKTIFPSGEDAASLLEPSIAADPCLKDNKETQTSEKEPPDWLQPTPILPYPYNFINAVKRKLESVINSPQNFVEVGVQNSLMTPREGQVTSKEEIIQRLKSACSEHLESHKGPDLDLNMIEAMELMPPISAPPSRYPNAVSRTLFTADSESDTSKNIPEISSESVVSAEPRSLLNLDKIQQFKLAIAEGNGYQETESYSSDFVTDSITSKTNVNGHKSRSRNLRSKESSKRTSTVTTQNNKEIAENLTYEMSGSASYEPSFRSLLTNSHSKHTVLKEPAVSLKLGNFTDDAAEDSSNKSVSVNSYLVTGVNEKSIPESKAASSLSTENVASSDEFSVQSVSIKKPDDPTLKKQPVLINFKDGAEAAKGLMKNITIRTAPSPVSNEIHLKFEAEVRLLNDFSGAYKQFTEVEKAFQTLKHKNNDNGHLSKILQNVDTQTSFVTRTSTNVSALSAGEKTPRTSRSSINFSRGSDIIDEIHDSRSLRNSTFSTEFNLSNVNDSTMLSTAEEEISRLSISNIGNSSEKGYAGILSLNICDQLIKDEAVRIQQLKAIIKIREQALLDRTKGELVWLEIQKKQLIETGKTEEASLLKKKQRGIILKHEQERNEIKKLKQMQKQASEKRKHTLRQQRNLIKSRLSTENMLEIRVKRTSERRSRGPLKVIQSCSESLETSTLSVTSKSLRDIESDLEIFKDGDEKVVVSNAKRTLLMREAALQKRRETAEELLRWHRKLLEEEKKIADLEAAAASVVKRTADLDEYGLAVELWQAMKGVAEDDVKRDVISSDATEKTAEEARTGSEENYTSAFESESAQEINNSPEEKTKISSITELIDNFSRIEDEISSLGKKKDEESSLKSEVIEEFEDTDELEASPETEGLVTVETAQGKSEENHVPMLKTKCEATNESKQALQKIEPLIVSSRAETLKTETSLSLEAALNSASKIEESLVRINEKLSPERSEDTSTTKDVPSIEESISTQNSPETSPVKEDSAHTSPILASTVVSEKSSSVSTVIEDSPRTKSEDEKTPQKKIDVKKRVSEILADANGHLSRGDKSPRMQDLYTTAYDVGTPVPDFPESLDEGRRLASGIFNSEAEELWRQQLAIEQEIKALEQQQKGQIPYVYMREIPNKPPPPYTPPATVPRLPPSALPTDVKEVNVIASYSSKVLYKAHQNNNLEKVKFSENGFKLFSKVDVPIICAEFVFNVCRDLAKGHYKQFENLQQPSWLTLPTKPHVAKIKPSDAEGLERILNGKLKELFGFKKAQMTESAIIKWGRKKRDHVDEVLVRESQEEEPQWTNFDQDELIVKDQVVNDIMKMLLSETAIVFDKIIKKKMNVN